MKFMKTIALLAVTITFIACERGAASRPQNEITDYGLMCDLDKGSGFAANQSIYRVDVQQQQVRHFWPAAMKGDESMVENYKKCKVWDIKNWECKYDDGSGTFGFSNGIARSKKVGAIAFLGVDEATWNQAHNNTPYADQFCKNNEQRLRQLR